MSAQATASKRPDISRSAAGGRRGYRLAGQWLPPSTVVVPKIATTTVSRGDSLWRLSQVTYGAGTRYAVIYKANREQIRNPNLIYPGQIFVASRAVKRAHRSSRWLTGLHDRCCNDLRYSAADCSSTFSARTAQNLNSGILPNGSSAGLVNRLAAASA